MIPKRPLDFHRLRSALPPGFGWLDHRLLREGYFQSCNPPAFALYCLLVCAADSQGLSFYSDRRIADLLGLEPAALWQARRELLEADLIAFERPLYQVLALPETPGRFQRRSTQARAIAPKAPVPSRTQKPAARLLSSPEVAAPEGLDLPAMVKASLRQGGGQ